MWSLVLCGGSTHQVSVWIGFARVPSGRYGTSVVVCLSDSRVESLCVERYGGGAPATCVTGPREASVSARVLCHALQ